jgi:hypothetical protein
VIPDLLQDAGETQIFMYKFGHHRILQNIKRVSTTVYVYRYIVYVLYCI